MFSKLPIALGAYGIAGGLGVVCQLRIFFGDMGCRTPNTNVRSIGLHRAVKLITVVCVSIVVAAAA